MSLEICETTTPEKLILKNSRFFKGRVRLIIAPDAERRFTKISDDLYYKQKKYYFPIFENIIFLKVLKDNQPENLPVIFNGTFIVEDEIKIIRSAIRENNEKENAKYMEYKKTLDKEISAIMENLKSEIANQKKFLKKDYLTKHQYNEIIKKLISAYADIITIKLGNDINLKSDDMNVINKFYCNKIEDFRNNNINKDIVTDIKEDEIKNIEPDRG
jgi:hypothetical protein